MSKTRTISKPFRNGVLIIASAMFITMATTIISYLPNFQTASFVKAETTKKTTINKTKTKIVKKIPLPKRKIASLEKAPVKKPKPKHVNLKDELSPLNKVVLSATEASNFSATIKAIFKNQKTKAETLKQKLTDPVTKKMIAWYALRSPNQTQTNEQLKSFIKDNPAWPSRKRLLTKIELQYYKGKHDPKDIIAYFSKLPPKTQTGIISYAEALLTTHVAVDDNKATKLIRDIYQSPKLSNWLEKRIMSRHDALIRTKDHEIRTDRLLYQDRRSKIAGAMRAAKHLNKKQRQAARFRAAVIKKRTGEAKKLLSKLDKATKNQPGVYLARVQLARRTKNLKTATKLLVNAKFKPSEITDKDEWWIERRYMARTAINTHDYKNAYKIASNHENPSVNRYKEAEFLSGWIALQFLKKPELAEEHFKKFKQHADGPRSGSKSHYWLGRAQKTLKKDKQASENFKESAKLFNTYYGQLSAYELKDSSLKIVIPKPPTITPEIAKTFTDREVIKAIVIAHNTKNKSLARLFFAHLRYHLKEPAELHMLAELAASLGYNQSTVRIGKTAMARNVPLAHYSYPVRFMPAYKPLRSEPEHAIVYSIARQESEFNYEIKSRAGARGLMQVMPNTLKYLARKYKIKRSTAWLTQRPAYNAKVGSAYIADRHDEFGGSYIMTIAGFNAGPGRVRQWVRKFGDPRSSHIDPIDWVERIPFTETRNYVQKVMANLQVYRARLKDGTSTIKSHQDLQRGKF